jgi:phage shock protein C
MSTRERPKQPAESLYDPLEDVTDEDVELYMAEQAAEEEEQRQKPPGFFNLQTGSGLALIGVGVVYLLQQLGFLPLGFNLGAFVALLPWLAGILIILTGFGVLSWSPARRRRKAREEAARKRRQAQARRAQGRTMGRGYDATKAKQMAEAALREAGNIGNRAFDSISSRTGKTRSRRLVKSRKDRKVLGVCAGIARYLGVDPIIVRIAFVVGAVFGSGVTIPLYLVLAAVMPNADADDDEPADPLVRITRD